MLDKDRTQRLRHALRCALIALSLFLQLEHAPYARIAANTVRGISEEAGDLFAELWAELDEEMGIGEMPEWLID